MFESIVSKLTSTVRHIVRAIRVATSETPWLAPVAILVLFFVL